MMTWGIGSDLPATILRKGRPSPAARKACLKNRHGDDVTILHGKLYTGLRTKTTRVEPSPTNNSIISCVMTQFPRRWFTQGFVIAKRLRNTYSRSWIYMGSIAEILSCYCRAYCTNINSGPSLSNSSLKLSGQHKSVSGTIKDLSCVSLLSLKQVRLIQLGCKIFLRYKIDKGARAQKFESSNGTPQMSHCCDIY